MVSKGEHTQYYKPIGHHPIIRYRVVIVIDVIHGTACGASVSGRSIGGD